jgi:hypothetical protein
MGVTSLPLRCTSSKKVRQMLRELHPTRRVYRVVCALFYQRKAMVETVCSGTPPVTRKSLMRAETFELVCTSGGWLLERSGACTANPAWRGDLAASRVPTGAMAKITS